MAHEAKQPIDQAANQHDDHTHDHGSHHRPAPTGRYLALLSLSALGIVYGDIGTSPLYAMRESFHAGHGLALTPANILGVVSLIFWALVTVVTIKYLIFIVKADNRGEGGILALTALATPIKQIGTTGKKWVVLLGVFGAALLYGDGIITPAISVLSSIEGLNVATDFFQPYIIPLTILILIGLFLIQRFGTALVGKLFGPITLLWFTVLAVLGIVNIIHEPGVIRAINPLYGWEFFQNNGWKGFLVLGSVFLVVTGGEALYADMGHFGRRPIRIAWYVVVLPALLLNYMGQAALLIREPEAVENSFFRMAPSWALYPLVILATLATVIASQALISGAFSITMQASQLGFLPRTRTLHTSRTEYGQIYIPVVNWLLMVACILVVIAFQTSSNLAAAYGIAVTSTMAITSIIFYVVAREHWGWSALKAGSLTGFFLVIDMGFLIANAVKIPHGGWFPLVVAVVLFTIMTTWKRGQHLVSERASSDQLLSELTNRIAHDPPVRVPGTAIFLSARRDGAPEALLANMRHNGVLHQHILLVTVEYRQVPHVEEHERFLVGEASHGFRTLTIFFGFMEDPDVPNALAKAVIPGLPFDPEQTTYFVNRTKVIATKQLPGMALWRERLYAVMLQNSTSAADFFSLPPTSTIEIGTRVEV
ncbi:potassium transporter Kup [Herpetosiphon sp. NSE202]|uniref:potassium transporter Kup n=1 Tax=Herpetosiphon sp. NSE202 TaxID=3351349 RepID=UPI00362D127D